MEKDGLNALLAASHTDRQTLHADLTAASDYMATLEDKVYAANQKTLDLLKTWRERESGYMEEVSQLKSYIIEMKARVAIYIPVKEDALDLKIAEYINNYPDRTRLKIMFMRESAGVYAFGTKRINVEVQQDRIKVRVGGGYLSIDEFIDQYTPTEVEKQLARDPLMKFSGKVAVQMAV